MNSKTMTIETVERQLRYVAAQRRNGDGLGVVFADAFLRGMRDLGYKSPAWAVSELVDNAFQADATTCSVGFGFEDDNKSQAKPDFIAIADDGNGMIPEMISYAVRWGGTDREGDRTGFGRYGYGLPSSAVSIAKRYSVYSKVRGGEWHMVRVDIEKLASAANDIHATQRLLTAVPKTPPAWLSGACDPLMPESMESGSFVVLEDLDRLKKLRGWITRKVLKAKLLNHMGVIYRHWLPERLIVVDGDATQSVDPLFLMEHGRFYDENAVRAERVETRSISVETARGSKGTVTIRASVMPPTFQLRDPDEFGSADLRGLKKNSRFAVMKEANGLLICRERRQIDCIAPRWTSMQNYDVNIKVEIDFDPELDEFFGITTAKQQIVIDDIMWEKLEGTGNSNGNLKQLVKDLRSRFRELTNELEADAAARAAVGDVERASINALDETATVKDRPPELSSRQRAEAERALDQEAARRAKDTGKPRDQVWAELASETSHGGWKLHFEAIPEGPVYRPRRLGEMKQLIVNTEHPFYTKLFKSAPAAASALEVLLLVLSERELEASDQIESFYRSERSRWSDRLRHALDALVSDATMANVASALAVAEGALLEDEDG